MKREISPEYDLLPKSICVPCECGEPLELRPGTPLECQSCGKLTDLRINEETQCRLLD